MSATFSTSRTGVHPMILYRAYEPRCGCQWLHYSCPRFLTPRSIWWKDFRAPLMSLMPIMRKLPYTFLPSGVEAEIYTCATLPSTHRLGPYLIHTILCQSVLHYNDFEFPKIVEKYWKSIDCMTNRWIVRQIAWVIVALSISVID